jgi:hypothetical protein
MLGIFARRRAAVASPQPPPPPIRGRTATEGEFLNVDEERFLLETRRCPDCEAGELFEEGDLPPAGNWPCGEPDRVRRCPADDCGSTFSFTPCYGRWMIRRVTPPSPRYDDEKFLADNWRGYINYAALVDVCCAGRHLDRDYARLDDTARRRLIRRVVERIAEEAR